MDVRILAQQDLLPALHLIWEVFVQDVAPCYTPEGVAEFQKFIKYDHMNEMYQTGEVIFFGAYDGTALNGIMAMQKKGHICLFYVKKSCQGQGIGRMLFEAVRRFAVCELRVSEITVNAAPDAVPKYQRFGFASTAPEQMVDGMRFVPMQLAIKAPMQGKKNRTLLIAGIIAGSVVLGAVFLFGAFKTVKGIMQNVRESAPWHNSQQPYDGGDGNDGSGNYDEYGDYRNGGEDADDIASDGLDAVPVYQADGLDYEVKDESYTYSDREKKTMVVDFNVKYPQLDGLEEETEKKINKILEECAMETVDKIYTNPSDEIKEQVLAAEVPALVSYVDYKVSYSGRDLLSVIYQDYSYQGDSQKYYVNLRTRNINLKDGTVYEVKDIVDINDSFLKDWLSSMRNEADNEELLSELGEKEQKKALEGDSQGGVYTANFFACRDGIEIGFDFNYEEGDSNDLGYAWVTAPFGFDDIREYKTKSDFWKALD